MRIEQAGWAEDLPVGSHRYPTSWLDDRFDWRDLKGKPIAPDWKRLLPKESGESVHDSAEIEATIQEQFALEYHRWGGYAFTVDHRVKIAGQEITVNVLSLEFDEASITPPELQEVMTKTLQERRLEKDIPKLLQKSVSEHALKIEKAERQSRLRLAVSGFAEELHAGLEQICRSSFAWRYSRRPASWLQERARRPRRGRIK